jgi:mono/diheme cytochrome c family protein
MCHGSDGRGDGPLASTLRPRPADLRVHMAMGHTDGQLFDFVTDGLPGTAMSAFGQRLSEVERWHVINYIRGFAVSRPTQP